VTRELILLAVSRKYGKYCVAGIDTSSGQWLRLVTTDSDAHYAIDPKDLITDTGETAKKLDVVQVPIIDRSISYFQSENYIIRKKSPWHRVRTATIAEVISLHPPDQEDYIFYDTKRRIPRDFYATLAFEEIRSLMLVSAKYARVEIVRQEDVRKVQLLLSYKGKDYDPLPVTDIEFCELCSEIAPGIYPIRKQGILLCSVGECYERDQYHYKLVAGIMLEQD